MTSDYVEIKVYQNPNEIINLRERLIIKDHWGCSHATKRKGKRDFWDHIRTQKVGFEWQQAIF